jgi:hypothetical protein
MATLELLKAEIHNHIATEYLKGSTKTEIRGIEVSWKKPNKELSRKKLELLADEEAKKVVIALYGEE